MPPGGNPARFFEYGDGGTVEISNHENTPHHRVHRTHPQHHRPRCRCAGPPARRTRQWKWCRPWQRPGCRSRGTWVQWTRSAICAPAAPAASAAAPASSVGHRTGWASDASPAPAPRSFRRLAARRRPFRPALVAAGKDRRNLQPGPRGQASARPEGFASARYEAGSGSTRTCAL